MYGLAVRHNVALTERYAPVPGGGCTGIVALVPDATANASAICGGGPSRSTFTNQYVASKSLSYTAMRNHQLIRR